MRRIYMIVLILNLMHLEGINSLSVKRLRDLLCFVYDEISVNSEYKSYHPSFALEANDIIRGILLNNNILELNNEDDTFCLKNRVSAENVLDVYPEHKADDNVIKILESFIRYDKEVV